MSASYKRTELGRGIFLTEMYDKKFKTNRIKVSFIMKPSKELVYAHMLLPTLLVTSNSELRDRAELTRRLAGLYGSSIVGGTSRTGDLMATEVAVSFIGDRYTIGGDEVSTAAAEQMIKCLLSPDITDGRFNQEYFELRRREMADNIRASVNDKRFYAYLQAEKLIFRGEPMLWASAHSPEDAEKLEQEQVMRAYRRMLEESVIEISVCGDGSTDKALDMVVKALTALERPERKGVVYRSDSPLKPQPERGSMTMDVHQSKVYIAYKSAFRDIYVCKVFAAMLGGTPFSKLFLNVRERMSLCYYCSAGYHDLKGTLLIDSGADDRNIARIESAVDEQLEALCRGDFTDEELANTKRFLCGLYQSNFDSVSGMMGWYDAQITRGTSYTPGEQSEIVMAVTRELVIECARSFKKDSVFILSAKGGDEG